MYNADDILKIDGRYVLPAVARWRSLVSAACRASPWIRRPFPARLVGINYSKAGQATIQSFDLRPRTAGWPTARPDRAGPRPGQHPR